MFSCSVFTHSFELPLLFVFPHFFLSGTGKSLSLACASIAWLKYTEQIDLHRQQPQPQPQQQSSSSQNHRKKSSPTGIDWLDEWTPEDDSVRLLQEAQTTATNARAALTQQLQSIQLQYQPDDEHDTLDVERLQQRRENVARQAIVKVKLEQKKALKQLGRRRRKKPKTTVAPLSQQHYTYNFELDEYQPETTKSHMDSYGDDSDEEHPSDPDGDLLYKSQARDLLAARRLDGSYAAPHSSNHIPTTIGRVTPASGVRKIIYAARTHSQLSQFLKEVSRTHWGKSNHSNNRIRAIALGSRSQGLCGQFAAGASNNSSKLVSERTMTELCLDMQKSKKRSSSGDSSSSSGCGTCPYYDQESIQTLGMHLLTQPTDIEEAGRLGAASKTCAYYSTRAAVAAAELVVVPYSMLVSKQTREAVGLSLKNALVVVDEAHNLPEAIRGLHSSTLNLPTCQAALEQLTKYVDKYKERLCGRNLHFLGHLSKICNSFIKHLSSLRRQGDTTTTAMQSSSEFLLDLSLDSINLFRLLRYMEHSRLSQKLMGFMSHQKQQEGKEHPPEEEQDIGLSKHVSPMSVVETFLDKLNHSGAEGKIVSDPPSTNDPHPKLRYVLLHPAACCKELLTEPHALCLVGGTLRPFAHVAAEIVDDPEVLKVASEADQELQKDLGSYHNEKLTAFTCSHVVSSSNVLLQTLGAVGPTKLDLRHKSRTLPSVCDAIGNALLMVIQSTPSGMVVFLPSYSYEAFLVEYWRKTGLLERLKAAKRVFREPKSSSQIESTLEAYSKAASKGNGSLLFSVVGGKLSEGINFADDMARAVVVVGLPYPDITDPILKEKLRLLDSKGGLSSQAYYQNLCMRAVNQSVGRAIRHANDYASVILLDSRYQSDGKIAKALPQWLTSSTAGWREGKMDSVQRSLRDFFDSKKN